MNLPGTLRQALAEAIGTYGLVFAGTAPSPSTA